MCYDTIKYSNTTKYKMAGGLLQIVAYSALDVYLTNNPQITYFKTVFRRHTNFSMEMFEQTLLDNPNFGTKNSAYINRLGDLITQMYLKVTIAGVTPPEGAKFAWCKRLGHGIFNWVDIRIGASRIEQQYGTWLDIWYELARTDGHARGYKKMIGDVPELTELNTNVKPEYTLYIPLKFWFNRHNGLALPLIAIQYDRVEFNVQFNRAERLIVTNSLFTTEDIKNLQILDVGLMTNYIYLDLQERERFARIGHEYLIEQVQFNGEDSAEQEVKRYQLLFNHPVKELIWAMKNGIYMTNQKFLCYSHEDDWHDTLVECSRNILENSIILLRGPIKEIDPYGNETIIVPGEDPPDEGTWEEFEPGANSSTSNGKIQVQNNNETQSLWINVESLLVDGVYNLTDKIIASLIVLNNDTVIFSNVDTELTGRDVSFPTVRITDTRLASDDVCVNQCVNYGLYIDGSGNPIQWSRLLFNEQERFERRHGKFFNILQPDMYHSNTPKDGINVYAFCGTPQTHQPTGTANFSTIENIILTLEFGDNLQTMNVPPIDLINIENEVYIFAFGYNVLQVNHGLAAVSYSG